MRNRTALLALAALPFLPLETQRYSRWALNLGYTYATYPNAVLHYSGLGLGLQVPLGVPFRLSVRGYIQNSSDDQFSDGGTVDLGLQAGMGNRVGEITLLTGISANGVSDDYVPGGPTPHFGAMGRLWVYRWFGVYGEWIRRPQSSGWSERQAGLGFGITISKWP